MPAARVSGRAFFAGFVAGSCRVAGDPGPHAVQRAIRALSLTRRAAAPEAACLLFSGSVAVPCKFAAASDRGGRGAGSGSCLRAVAGMLAPEDNADTGFDFVEPAGRGRDMDSDVGGSDFTVGRRRHVSDAGRAAAGNWSTVFLAAPNGQCGCHFDTDSHGFIQEWVLAFSLGSGTEARPGWGR